jgi:hypothetical protein
MSTKISLCQRKTEGGLEKGLANLWRKINIKKKARAFRGQETKWGIPVKMFDIDCWGDTLRSSELPGFNLRIK